MPPPNMPRRKKILESSQMRSCLLEKDALLAFERYLDAHKDATVKVLLPAVLDIVSESSAERGRISGASMEHALKTLEESTFGDDRDGGDGSVHFDHATVVPLHATPPVSWSERWKKFVHNDAHAATNFPPPVRRAEILHNRFFTIKQRLFRVVNITNPHHSVYADGGSSGADAFVRKHTQNQQAAKLYRLSSLEGVSATTVMTVLARLSKTDEDVGKEKAVVLYLEDDTMRIRTELSAGVLEGGANEVTTGIFFDGCIVVATGRYRGDGVFFCDALGLPPPEPRESSLAALSSHIDFFGLPPPQNHIPALTQRLQTSASTIFFLAQVTLTRKTTLQRVANFARGVAQMTQQYEGRGVTIVLIGNFLERGFVYGDTLGAGGGAGGGVGGDRDIHAFSSLLTQLATTISASAPTLAQNAHFVLVPGENDPAILGGGAGYPMQPFPSFVADTFRARLKHTTLAPNPARLRFLTKEIMVFREELQAKLLSKAVVPPMKQSGNVSVVETIASQAHLLPLPPRFASVSAAHDAALRLYPLPDLMLLCDRDKSWSYEYTGCDFVNPGSFTRNGTFLVYEPRTGQHDIQLVPL